jgi:hypothetical protein
MTDRDEAGRFAPGNRFWEARSSHGAKPKFENPDDLWDACAQYFEFVEDTPLSEQRGFAFQGKVTKEDFPLMRAMTLGGMCIFLDISLTTWHDWRKNRPDLSEVITRVEQIIYTQKFEGAAAGLLNPNIIARDLGLAEKKLHGNDPDNPLPEQTVVTYQLPDNGREKDG